MLFSNVVLPMAMSAAVIGGLAVYLFSADNWKPYLWIVVSPLLYLGWLIGFLVISALACGLIGKKHPKSRHQVVRLGDRRGNMGFFTAQFCYRRLAVINSLPLVPALRPFGSFQKLVLRAYSPSVHIGNGFSMAAGSQIFDPDVTEIGEDVMVGAHSIISAHLLSRLPDGELNYMLAPIKIGDRVTIGGGAIVCAGSVIGDDAIIEIGSVVSQFTRVPPGEIWSGNPATLLKKRADMLEAPAPELEMTASPVRQQEPPTAKPEPASAPGVEPVSEHIRALVIEALLLKPEEIRDPLNAETCEFWDSMGQMAIAAMLKECYAVSVPAKQVPRIRNLQDVADLIAGRGLEESPSRPSPRRASS
jgi:acetyltransferase-like isoleucine patch superfamily enzyme/acyl carrier protein